MLRSEELTRAWVGAADHMVAGLSPKSPITRMAFARLRDELAKSLEREESTIGAGPAVLEATFTGTPVFGSSGIDADFSAKALGSVMAVVAAVSAGVAASTDQPAVSGRRRRKSVNTKRLSPERLMVTSVVPGSFGFRLEQSEPNTVSHELDAALDAFMSTMSELTEASAAAQDPLLEKLNASQLKAMQRLSGTMAQAEAGMKLSSRTRAWSFTSAKLADLSERLRDKDIETTILKTIGRFHLLPGRGTFELEAPDGSRRVLVSGSRPQNLTLEEAWSWDAHSRQLVELTYERRRITTNTGVREVCIAIAARPLPDPQAK